MVVNIVQKFSCLLVELMELLIEIFVNSNVIKLNSDHLENVKTKHFKFHAINVEKNLLQFVELMEEIIKILVNALAKVHAKNTLKEDVLKKKVVPDALECLNQSARRKELHMIMFVIWNVHKTN